MMKNSEPLILPFLVTQATYIKSKNLYQILLSMSIYRVIIDEYLAFRKHIQLLGNTFFCINYRNSM